MERVIIDMDEVIADPMGAMITWYEKAYGLQVDLTKMKGSWLLGFPENHQALVRERLYEPGFFRNLPVMKDSVDVLKEMNNRYEIFIVSAATEFPNSLKDKLDLLLEHFPFFSCNQLVLCGYKLLVYCVHMIDVHVRHLQYFNGKKHLLTAAHNKDITGYVRINSWEDAAKVFLQ